ncbi:methyltransferase domain-containing protein [Ornithinimicrobium pratense]|uniref:Methyltransferase domain-containing protein n=1 Tax=Ornithinimicrobium pratense TaxID=2593973 RepID=A0A5J6V651_9MICO|nr:methyltransferase domain-containing protein [Ornithinimicrobium pratense]QFG68606.1 methyltransferase domain-containing protein [Ornithinimicrobium pratense]
MQCDYFDAGACGSCTLMGVPYAAQLASTQRTAAAYLAEHVPHDRWLDPQPSREAGFRNKAKLVVGGRKGAPTLGILDPGGEGVELRHCGLYEAELHRAVLVLADLVASSGLTPYDVPTRQGELKHLLVTVSPDAQLMVRLVLRSPGQLSRVRELAGPLRQALPGLRVLSVNLQPEHKAVLEGSEELVLSEQDTLPMRVNDLVLHLGTRSFFQTNTAVAAALYAQAARWVDGVDGGQGPRVLWDLYCGVGGFALHCAAPGREVLGVEVSQDAVASARRSAEEQGLTDTHFHEGDATTMLGEAGAPDMVVVNPPRRGLGPRLAGRLEQSHVQHLVYSSCNARSLAGDLSRMPSWQVERARLFDMFPQTDHHEVAVLLRRR